MQDKDQLRRDKLAKAKHEADKEARVFYDCFNTAQGKEAYRLMRELFYDRSSFVDKDSHKMAFFEGQRDVVMFIRKCIKYFEQGVDGNEHI